MEELKLPVKLKVRLGEFVKGLSDIYSIDLISVILYGSAASGEFVDRHSNLNVLAVLKKADLLDLKKSAIIIKKYPEINALFFDKNYIISSLDVFPIEFLDMKENYAVLYGEDLLKDLNIDLKNLRFQCEHELKAKLINLRQSYIKIAKNNIELKDFLFRSFTSTLHIARNLLRLKGKAPVYSKDEIINDLAKEFLINDEVWKRLLSAKNKKIEVKPSEIDVLFIEFVKELDNLVSVVDKI
ncbi:MAG: hypothetical protein PHO70_02055 [Candidatus Omnitrophica bacterium]|nr:hypothetical protein [Candidatus Omnitrophota bacterium]